MADINDPEVIAFSNAYLRPISERLRDLALLLDDAAVEYTTNIAGKLAAFADGDVLVDGRAGEGVTQVTKKDIADFIAQVSSARTPLVAAGADSLRSKFTVRPPRL